MNGQASEDMVLSVLTLLFYPCRETTVLCQVSNILATGLMQSRHLIPSNMSVAVLPVKKDSKKDKTPGKSSTVKTAPKVASSSFDPDIQTELRQALEVCIETKTHLKRMKYLIFYTLLKNI